MARGGGRARDRSSEPFSRPFLTRQPPHGHLDRDRWQWLEENAGLASHVARPRAKPAFRERALVEVWRSEPVADTGEPRWSLALLPLARLCHANLDRPVTRAVFDLHACPLVQWAAGTLAA